MGRYNIGDKVIFFGRKYQPKPKGVWTITETYLSRSLVRLKQGRQFSAAIVENLLPATNLYLMLWGIEND